MMTCVLMTATGFLSGSVMYSYLLPRWLKKIDVRQQSEDGNPGSMNAIAASGPWMGLTCLALDVMKAGVPVCISVTQLGVSGYYVIPVMVAPVLGHAFTPFLGFKGGKGVSVAFGSLLGAMAVSSAFLVLASIMVLFRFIVVVDPDSAKVIAAFTAASLAVIVMEPLIEITIAVLAISLLVCGKQLMKPNDGELRATIGSFETVYAGRNTRIRRKT